MERGTLILPPTLLPRLLHLSRQPSQKASPRSLSGLFASVRLICRPLANVSGTPGKLTQEHMGSRSVEGEEGPRQSRSSKAPLLAIERNTLTPNKMFSLGTPVSSSVLIVAFDVESAMSKWNER